MRSTPTKVFGQAFRETKVDQEAIDRAWSNPQMRKQFTETGVLPPVRRIARQIDRIYEREPRQTPPQYQRRVIQTTTKKRHPQILQRVPQSAQPQKIYRLETPPQQRTVRYISPIQPYRSSDVAYRQQDLPMRSEPDYPYRQQAYPMHSEPDYHYRQDQVMHSEPDYPYRQDHPMRPQREQRVRYSPAITPTRVVRRVVVPRSEPHMYNSLDRRPLPGRQDMYSRFEHVQRIPQSEGLQRVQFVNPHRHESPIHQRRIIRRHQPYPTSHRRYSPHFTPNPATHYTNDHTPERLQLRVVDALSDYEDELDDLTIGMQESESHSSDYEDEPDDLVYDENAEPNQTIDQKQALDTSESVSEIKQEPLDQMTDDPIEQAMDHEVSFASMEHEDSYQSNAQDISLDSIHPASVGSVVEHGAETVGQVLEELSEESRGQLPEVFSASAVPEPETVVESVAVQDPESVVEAETVEDEKMPDANNLDSILLLDAVAGQPQTADEQPLAALEPKTMEEQPVIEEETMEEIEANTSDLVLDQSLSKDELCLEEDTKSEISLDMNDFMLLDENQVPETQAEFMVQLPDKLEMLDQEIECPDEKVSHNWTALYN
ncbi:hypothetical protein EDD86DRAFT_205296 [Gorgonomyces haynaldii]|nr:hypothetical protein EDD86DRAFT_205296 [Gorgonomyces haynaldii]